MPDLMQTRIQEKSEILRALQEGKFIVHAQFMASSNYTFLGKIIWQGEEIEAVYKPQKGENPLWDFSAGTLCKREVVAFLASEWLNWDLVPPTVFRKRGPLGAGSLQYFVDNNPDRHYFSFDAKTRQRLRPAVLFDLVINNADRKGSHILLDEQEHLWLIDHGICFHHEYKLRTVVWDFAGENIPNELLTDIENLLKVISENNGMHQELTHWLSPGEINAMQARIQTLLKMKTYPFPDQERRVFPWPPL